MPVKNFHVGLIQMECSANPDENLEKAVSKVEEAARGGAEVICLQELFRSRYFCQAEDTHNFQLVEDIPGPTTNVLGQIAKDKNVVIIASIFERRALGVYHNTNVILDSSGIVGKYRKMHIPEDPGYHEKFYFTPGDLGYKAFNTDKGCIGSLVCWDQWYPEAARLTALQGASILFYPTAIGWHPKEKKQYGVSQREAWRTIQRSHAIANGVYVAAVNRVGHEPSKHGDGIEFWGSSFICDPFGVIVAEASIDREEILYAEIDMKRIEEVRCNWPFLRDRRIDSYQKIDQRFIDPDIS